MSELFANRDVASSASSFSPKSSPRGSRSPMAAPSMSRHDSTGTLKMTISAGKHPAVVNSGPFYLMKEPAGETELTGATNLMAHYGLEHSYNKFTGKKVKDSLSSFLPSLPGILDTPAHFTNSSLRSLIDKPPVFKEFVPLSTFQLNGFRLQHGPLPEQYRFQSKPSGTRRHKHHKKSNSGGSDSVTPSHDASASNDFSLGLGGSMNISSVSTGGNPSTDGHEKKPHKKKKNDDEKEKKKKKKEKKKKKQRHSPEHMSIVSGDSKMIL